VTAAIRTLLNPAAAFLVFARAPTFRLVLTPTLAVVNAGFKRHARRYEVIGPRELSFFPRCSRRPCACSLPYGSLAGSRIAQLDLMPSCDAASSCGLTFFSGSCYFAEPDSFEGPLLSSVRVLARYANDGFARRRTGAVNVGLAEGSPRCWEYKLRYNQAV
jgi:glutamine amidotransferase-like uncharacterized protein